MTNECIGNYINFWKYGVFEAIHVGKLHGIMEKWNVGILGIKNGKRSILEKIRIPSFQL